MGCTHTTLGSCLPVQTLMQASSWLPLFPGFKVLDRLDAWWYIIKSSPSLPTLISDYARLFDGTLWHRDWLDDGGNIFCRSLTMRVLLKSKERAPVTLDACPINSVRTLVLPASNCVDGWVRDPLNFQLSLTELSKTLATHGYRMCAANAVATEVIFHPMVLSD